MKESSRPQVIETPDLCSCSAPCNEIKLDEVTSRRLYILFLNDRQDKGKTKTNMSFIHFDFICFLTLPEHAASRIPNTDKCCHLVDTTRFSPLMTVVIQFFHKVSNKVYFFVMNVMLVTKYLIHLNLEKNFSGHMMTA